MKNWIIGIIIAAIIVIGGGCLIFANNKKTNTDKTNKATVTDSSNPANTSANKKDTTNATLTSASVGSSQSFSNQESDEYYKLAQLAGDYGLPANALVANMGAFKTVDGVNYYKAYSYSTRAAYNNDSTTPANGNYSHLANVKYLSLDGKSIDASQFGNLDFSNLTAAQKQNIIFKLAAEYVEGYTANYPNLKVEPNDNYEGNLNDIPDINVDMNDTKVVNGETLYKATVDINNFKTPMYIGLDGYVFLASQQDFYQIFFPNKVA